MVFVTADTNAVATWIDYGIICMFTTNRVCCKFCILILITKFLTTLRGETNEINICFTVVVTIFFYINEYKI